MWNVLNVSRYINLLNSVTAAVIVFFIYSTVYSQQGGYVDKMSVTQGDTIKFYLSTSVSPINLTIYRVDSATFRRTITTFSNISTQLQSVPDSSYWYGCSWNETFRFVVPLDWEPGAYRAEFPSSSGTRGVLFFVKEDTLGSYSKILVVANTNTWQAYNEFGGKSLYPSSSPSRSYKVSFARPSTHNFGLYDFYKWEIEFLTWAAKINTKIEYVIDYDFDLDANLISNYDVVFLVAHNEYWSSAKRVQFENYINSGGKVVILSGNTCWWQVRFEDKGQTMVCYKSASVDPLSGVIDSLVTVNWYDIPVNNPENKFMGVSFRNGGYVNHGGTLLSQDGYGDYAAFNTQHWVFEGTGLKEGDEFGYDNTIVGYEVDGIKYSWQNGLPVPTLEDQAPANFRIMGLSPANATNPNILGENGAMGFYYAQNGGAVFNAGTIEWALGLKDTTVEKITRNILDRFLSDKFPPEIISWSPFKSIPAVRNNLQVYLNNRDTIISSAEILPLSITASDPNNLPIQYLWTVNGVPAGNNSSFNFPGNFDNDSVHVITGYAYNSLDTSSISWKVNVYQPFTPEPPLLVYPPNNSLDKLTSIMFKWQSSFNAEYYGFQLANDQDFSSIVFENSSLADTFVNVNGLPYLTKLYWRVKAKNYLGESSYSEVWNFTTIDQNISIPPPPQLVYPANNQTDLPNSISFVWNSAYQAFTYKIQLAIDPDFTTIVFSDSNIMDTTIQIDQLVNSANYYWRVYAQNPIGTSVSSEVRYFRTGGSPVIPAKPVHISPPNDSYNQPIQMTFKWYGSAGADNYRLQVSRNVGFSNIVFDGTVTGLEKTVTLKYNLRYYWRVRANSAAGSSPFTDSTTFVTIISPPSIPGLIYPANSATGIPLSLTLTWNAASYASTYHVQVSLNSSFTNLIAEDSLLTVTYKAIGPLNFNTRYYWRVRAKNISGTSSWSNIRNFTTIGAPSVPVLAAPANNAVNIPVSTILKWNKASNAVTYNLQVAADISFNSMIVNDSTLTDTAYQLNSLQYSTKYFWRVRSKNSGGSSSFSTIYNFTTLAQLPPVPVLLSPLNGAVNQNTNLNLVWHKSEGASNYRIQLSADSNFTVLVFDDSTVIDTVKHVDSLIYVTDYFWRVSAKNQSGQSQFSPIWKFRTMQEPVSLPTVPILASPPNGITNQPISLNLIWHPSQNAGSYRIQVSLDSNFTSLLLNDSTVADTSKLVDSMNYFSEYFWRVSAKNQAGESQFSPVWKFKTMQQPLTPPSVPLLASPVNGDIGQSISLNLVWHNSMNAEVFHIQFSADSNFTFLLLNDSTAADTFKHIDSLNYYTEYYWRVSAKNQAGESQFSPIWKFQTMQQPSDPPTIPLQAAPLNGSIDQPVSLKLTWYPSQNSELYNLQIAEDSVFSVLLLNDSTITDTFNLVDSLDYLTNYYWRVRAKNQAGSSQFSTVWKFKTIQEPVYPPSVPVLISPLDSSINLPVVINFVWNSALNSSNYHIQAAFDSLFTNIAFEDTLADTLKISDSLSYFTTYFWRVRALNSNAASSFTTARIFKTQEYLPEIPLLASPLNNSLNQMIPIDFRWNRSEGAQSYILQVSVDSTFQMISVYDSSCADTFKQVSSLINSTNYFWRVKGRNLTGLSGFSDIWKFTTIIGMPTQPQLLSPPDSAINQPINITFSWDAQNAQTYRLQVSRNLSFTRIVFDDSTITANSKLVSGLSYNLGYYWRVRAKNIAGTSSYSAIRIFGTIIAPPTAPSLSSPANNAVNQPVTINLVWNAVTVAETYRLQVSVNTDFSTLFFDDSTLTTTSKTVGVLAYNTRYYWRVSAKNISGTSPYSAIRKFNTIASQPPPVLVTQLYSAANSFKIEEAENKVYLTWTTVREIDLNDFEIERALKKDNGEEPEWMNIGRVKAFGSSDSLREYKFIDKNPSGGSKFIYRLKQTDRSEQFLYSNESEIEIIPDDFELYQNYPNPFNPLTSIKFALPVPSRVEVLLYNSLGELVERIISKEYKEGIFTEEYNASNLASGVYFYLLNAYANNNSINFRSVKKMILLK